MSQAIQLIVGLGNPGSKYQHTRHNVGFDFVDSLLPAGMSARLDKRFRSEIAELSIDGNRVWLLKPQTFMNLSGDAVGGFTQYYKIASENILVVHDELDLPPGQIRLKKGGGSSGHNGLKDIIAKLGSGDFIRLRIGIGHPGSADQVVGFVLQKAPASEEALIQDAMHRAKQFVQQIVGGDSAAVMNELHRKQ
jgi:PTH1 family peptidyl-tRNA hydrolase